MSRSPDDELLLTRQAHIDVVDIEKRKGKFRKIATIVERRRELTGVRLLDIGCGSGVMTAEFARAAGEGGRAVGIDVRDLRVMDGGFEFQRVEGVSLPFADESFDVVVANHVTEHVGDDAAQSLHLVEIRRVMAPDGILYISVPNRWRLIEPHVRLPLLSWLPRPMSDAYIRLFRRGPYYDVNAPSHRKIVRLLRGAGFEAEDVTYESMGVMAAVEDVRPLTRRALQMPESVFKLVRPFISTMIFVARRSR